MTVLRAFCIVLVSSFLGAIAGLGIGYALAVAAPAYYRGVFHGGNSPTFDPVQVGVGLGLTQGLIAGLFVGCVIVLTVAWYNSRRQVIIQDMGPRKWEPPGHGDVGGSEAFRPADPHRG